MAVHEAVPPWVNRYIGIPFRDLGRTRDGVDCWGLLTLVYQERFGRVLPAYLGEYQSAVDKGAIPALVDRERQAWTMVDPADIAEGDVVLLRMWGLPFHVGVVVCQGRFLHCLRGVGTALEAYDTPLWRNRVLGFYRYPYRGQDCDQSVGAG